MLSFEQREEVSRTIETLRRELDELVVRGLAAAGPDETRALESHKNALDKMEAHHLAGRIGELLAAIHNSGRSAAPALLRTQASLRVFERVLTLDHVRDLLASCLEDQDEVAPSAGPSPAPPPAMPEAEKQALLRTLDELARAVEDLITSGMTAASAATRQKITVSATEAARLKLNRLAPALRYVGEEVERFLKDNESFSATRLSFFLNRSWLLLRGISRAIAGEDARAISALLWQRGAPPISVPVLEAVTIGVSKRVVKGVSAAFDFRMRITKGPAPLVPDQPLVWTFLHAFDKNLADTFIADALLHLAQPQNFRPRQLLEPLVLRFSQAAVAIDDRGGARLLLGPPSKVELLKSEPEWSRYVGFDVARAKARVENHRPSPLDLEVEMEEEVALEDWTIGEPREGFRPDQVVYPVTWRNIELDAIASTQAEGKELREALDELRKSKKKKKPPLFGLVHYELCRIVLRPLAVLEKDGPRHLMISDEKVNLAELTRALMKRMN